MVKKKTIKILSFIKYKTLIKLNILMVQRNKINFLIFLKSHKINVKS